MKDDFSMGDLDNWSPTPAMQEAAAANPVRLHLAYTTYDPLGNIITDSHGYFRGRTRRHAIEEATHRILESASEYHNPVSWRIAEVVEPVRWQEPCDCNRTSMPRDP